MHDRHETAQDAARSVAIVGAGLSGIVAARDLAAVGFRVRVFEKSRGVGGRMATRRGDAGAFDHGAQYLRATGADFAREVAALEAQGVLARWPVEGGVHVGMPGMSAPVKRLAEGLARENAIETGFAVAAVDGEPGRRFVRSAEGALAGPFAVVLVAAPAPQTQALLAPLDTALADAVAQAAYEPTIALMLRFAPGSAAAPFEGAARFDHPAVAWIADDGAKPGREGAGARFVVHATSAYSRTHLERDPAEIAASLAAEAGRLLRARGEPLAAIGHRWRYARVSRAVGEPCLWDPAAGIGACGDWCLGPRIEAAYDSGRALAACVVRDLGARDRAVGGGR